MHIPSTGKAFGIGLAVRARATTAAGIDPSNPRLDVGLVRQTAPSSAAPAGTELQHGGDGEGAFTPGLREPCPAARAWKERNRGNVPPPFRGGAPCLWYGHHSAPARAQAVTLISILVIDDDPAHSRVVAKILRAEAVTLVSTLDGRSGIESVATAAPDVVLLDMDLPDMKGFAVLASITASAPELPVIIVTGDSELKSAIRATRLGAFDYLTKPIEPDELVNAVRRARATCRLRREVADLRSKVGGGNDLAAQMGSSAMIREVIEQVSTVSASLFTVLVLGETGTGKELVAQAIHRGSDRRGGPFVALDCGAIPEALLESELFGHQKGAFTGADRSKAGRFQLAEGGTLFLDEIGNLPISLQSKLLRVLESKQLMSVGAERSTAMNVRFIAATNDDLQARVGAGVFRADLYFRLAQYTITLPPLRERATDIASLAARFLEESSVELRRPVRSIDADAIELLEAQAWPGNVRELRNVVRQAVLRSTGLVIQKEHLRALCGKARKLSAAAPTPLPNTSLKDVASEAAAAAERRAICETLRVTHGNKSEAARALRTDYKTLHVKIKKLGIRARDFLE